METGVGDPVLEDLQQGTGSNFVGFKFTAPSKQQLMEGLAVDIQQGTTRFPAGVLVSELEALEYEYKRTGVRYGAPHGLHDDAVCALALGRTKSWRPSASRWHVTENAADGILARHSQTPRRFTAGCAARVRSALGGAGSSAR